MKHEMRVPLAPSLVLFWTEIHPSCPRGKKKKKKNVNIDII